MSTVPLPTSLRSHLAVYPSGCTLTRHDGFWAVTTPANPSYFWGNFLHFDAAPAAGDEQRWPSLFDRHVGAVGHRAMVWENGRPGALQAFTDAGFEVLDSLVMSAGALQPARPPALPATLRLLRDDADWQALVDFNVATRDAGFSSESGYRRYSEGRVAHWRSRCEAGTAVWAGAFVGGELASTLGLFAEPQPGADGLRLARYQEVTTAERWRRQGLCSVLLAFAAQALAPLRVARHVIVADEHDLARHVYAARGFETAGRWRGLLQAQVPAPTPAPVR